MKTAIELFIEHGYFDNICSDLEYFYKDNDSDENDDECRWLEWDEWDIDEKWENCKDYFKDFFRFTQDEVNSGVALWKDVDYDSKKNWDETRLKVIEIEEMNIRIYTRGLNILRFISGMAGLAYTYG